MNIKAMVFLLLLVLLGSEAMAQTPQRIVNFQGRVRDANNVYLDDTRQVTLRIYGSATGGSPLFTEVHNAVDFQTGLFTIPIGGATAGGLPAALDFQQQYWLGVQIANYNGNQEIEPRMPFHFAAYSFQAVHATSADNADNAELANTALSAEFATRSDSARSASTASTLTVPARVTGDASGAALEIINVGTTGLRVQGGVYSIVSRGIDSTTKHYVSAENAGTDGTPAPGGFYRDNAPMAWGVIGSGGEKLSSFGIDSVQVIRNGIYRVFLSNPVNVATVPPQGAQVPELSAIVQLIGIYSVEDGYRIQWTYDNASGPNYDRAIIVQISQYDDPVGGTFSLHIFGRPAR